MGTATLGDVRFWIASLSGSPPSAAEGAAERVHGRGGCGRGGGACADNDHVAFLQAFQYFSVAAVADPGLDRHGCENRPARRGTFFIDQINFADGRAVALSA